MRLRWCMHWLQEGVFSKGYSKCNNRTKQWNWQMNTHQKKNPKRVEQNEYTKRTRKQEHMFVLFAIKTTFVNTSIYPHQSIQHSNYFRVRNTKYLSQYSSELCDWVYLGSSTSWYELSLQVCPKMSWMGCLSLSCSVWKCLEWAASACPGLSQNVLNGLPKYVLVSLKMPWMGCLSLSWFVSKCLEWAA